MPPSIGHTGTQSQTKKLIGSLHPNTTKSWAKGLGLGGIEPFASHGKGGVAKGGSAKPEKANRPFLSFQMLSPEANIRGNSEGSNGSYYQHDDLAAHARNKF